MVIVDFRNAAFSGKEASNLLEQVGIIANHNLIPFDKRCAHEGSGLRLCTNVMAARELEHVSTEIFKVITDVFHSLSNGHSLDIVKITERVSWLINTYKTSKIQSN